LAVLAFIFALFLPQVSLRGVKEARGVGDGFAIPEGSDSECQLANVVAQILRRDNTSSLAGILARSGALLDVATAWGVLGVFVYQAAVGGPLPESAVEARVGVPSGVLTPFYRDIAAAGYLTRSSDGMLTLTGRGQAEAEKLVSAWQAWLMGQLRRWLTEHDIGPEQDGPVQAAVDRIVLRLAREAEAEARHASLNAVTVNVEPGA
jgi:hypothetical protein